jgi:aspartate racemase
MRQKIIGVLGGMGPEATIEFFSRIVRRTQAPTEQDHLRILLDNNPKVPPRMPAIAGEGRSCVPELVKSARALERAGADFIVIPCVTVHYFHAGLQKRTALPVLHIVDETVKRLQARCPAVTRVGLLATTGTIGAGLFQEPLARRGIEVLVPGAKAQKVVTSAIKVIKVEGGSARARGMVRQAADDLLARGAEAVIAGCTEIPLALKDGDLPVPVIDSIDCLADAAIARAGGRRRRGRG